MDSIRQQKISKLLLKELGQLLQNKYKHVYSKSLVTLTHVRVSPDLSVSKAYVSIFGQENKKDILQKLNEHSKEIRFDLGLLMKNQLRIIPDLKFFLDDSLDHVEKIEKLLKS